MHDPQTQAFRICYPWYKTHIWANGGKWRYWHPCITIWHTDPERDAYKKGCRSDDSCGWHTPPTTPEERAAISKLGEDQWGTIFEKRRATQEGKDYARVCFEPTTYDAIYWAWRAIKKERTPKWRRPVWQYGRQSRRAYLTGAERDRIYSLASCPVDNLQHIVSSVNSKESCADFFLIVYSAYMRFNRPWWKHPKWHFWHWHFQIHTWQTLRRWLFSRCSKCGKRFSWGYSPVTHQWDPEPPRWFRSETGVYHHDCSVPTSNCTAASMTFSDEAGSDGVSLKSDTSLKDSEA